MKAEKSKAAAIAFAIAISAGAVLPTAAMAESKDCSGDARTMMVSGAVYRMTGLTIFYDIMYRAAERRKFYQCSL